MATITEVRAFPVRADDRIFCFVRIRTDDGYEGIGEGTIPQRTRAIIGAVEDFADYLLGKEPSQIERHWQVLHRNSFQRGGPIQSTALSAIEQALWDIRGKVLNRPIWDLLGGAVRDRIRLYSHPGGGGGAVRSRRARPRAIRPRLSRLQTPSAPHRRADSR